MSIYDLSMFRMHPKADEHFVVQGDKYRITVLTEQLLRLEYSEDGVFEDRATRLAFNRAFDTPQYQVYRQNGRHKYLLTLECRSLYHCISNEDKEIFQSSTKWIP